MDMELTQFAFRIFLIFIPGIIVFKIVGQLTNHKEFKLHQIVIDGILYGLGSYFIYFSLLTRSLYLCPEVTLFKDLKTNQSDLDLMEIFIVAIISIPLGYVISVVINKKWLHRLAQKFDVSKKFADVDVWSYVMNSDLDPWIVVRSVKDDLMFEGWIAAFPDTNEDNGIFMRNVIVYKNSTGRKLYHTPGIYLSRDRDDLIVDFPKMQLLKQGGQENG